MLPDTISADLNACSCGASNFDAFTEIEPPVRGVVRCRICNAHNEGADLESAIAAWNSRDLRYLFRRQESTGIWIQERGPIVNAVEAQRQADDLFRTSAVPRIVGICTSEDGRTVITEYPE